MRRSFTVAVSALVCVLGVSAGFVVAWGACFVGNG